MRDNYGNLSWVHMRNDSYRLRESLENRRIFRMVTPGIGFSDTLQASTTVRSVENHYNPEKIVVNCYQPSMFRNNPRCTVGTNVKHPENVVLHSWPPHKLPLGGYGYPSNPHGVPLSITQQWDIRVGLWGIDHDDKQEFYPDNEELRWAHDSLLEYVPYVVIQLSASPPRNMYNQFEQVPNNRSTDRARTAKQVDWDRDRWILLVDALKAMGHNVLQIGAGFEDILPGCIDMTKVGPRRTFAVIGIASLCICHLSFPMFAANAVNTPALVFYSGSYTRGYESLEGVTMLDCTTGVACAPCPIEEAREWCPGTCMDNITAEYVIDEAGRVLYE